MNDADKQRIRDAVERVIEALDRVCPACMAATSDEISAILHEHARRLPGACAAMRLSDDQYAMLTAFARDKHDGHVAPSGTYDSLWALHLLDMKRGRTVVTNHGWRVYTAERERRAGSPTTKGTR